MKTILTILFVCILTNQLIAQNEKIKEDHHEEMVDTTTFSKLLKLHNEISRVYIEEKFLAKFDFIAPFSVIVAPSGSENQLLIGLRTDFERKIGKSWSGIISIDMMVISKTEYMDLNTGIGTRYYYNMKNRILKNKSANNFSGNFISLFYDRKLVDHTLTDFFNSMVVIKSANLVYGIQRRIGKSGYLDLYSGVLGIIKSYEYDKELQLQTYYPVASLKVGIGF